MYSYDTLAVLTFTKFPGDNAGVSSRLRPGNDPGLPRDVHPGCHDRVYPHQTVKIEATGRHDHVQPPSGHLQARLRLPSSVSCRRHAPLALHRSFHTSCACQRLVSLHHYLSLNTAATVDLRHNATHLYEIYPLSVTYSNCVVSCAVK